MKLAGITLIINQSIPTGSYPENLHSKSYSYFKNNDKLEIKIYRPISVLAGN